MNLRESALLIGLLALSYLSSYFSLFVVIMAVKYFKSNINLIVLVVSLT